MGEVIRIEADKATIQVYEETGMGADLEEGDLKLTHSCSWSHSWRSCGADATAIVRRTRTWSHGSHLRRHPTSAENHL